MRLSKQLVYILLAGLTLSACDSGPADDGKVTVQYAVSSETGASAYMIYLDAFGELQGKWFMTCLLYTSDAADE